MMAITHGSEGRVEEVIEIVVEQTIKQKGHLDNNVNDQIKI